MGKWEVWKPSTTDPKKWYIYDVDGETTSGEWICEACDEEMAQQICREHNVHEELVDLVKDLRNEPYGLAVMHKLSTNACELMIRDTWLPRIDAVLAQAEGRE